MGFARLGQRGRIFKVVLLGDGGVGKTSIKERFLGKGFKSNYMMTIGADFAIHEMKINGINGKQERVKLQIWDLAGQERFKNVRSGFYAGCLGALLVYDITRRDTADNLSSWVKELIENTENPEKLTMLLVANKTDLRKSYPSCITTKDGKILLKQLLYKKATDSQFFVETSAKEGVNISKAFIDLATTILEKLNK